jgi:hypothetical protein
MKAYYDGVHGYAKTTPLENLHGFLMTKLNSDMSPEAIDKFVPLIIKELGELKKGEGIYADTRQAGGTQKGPDSEG